MSTIQLNTKDFASQTSSAEPVIASGVTGSPALALTNATFPAGHVLQTLYDVDATAQSLSSVTYTATDLSIVITPSSASNKILATWTMMADLGAAEGLGTQLYSSEDGILYESGSVYGLYHTSGASNSRLHATYIHLDSPSSTSAITYTIKVASHSAQTINLNDTSNQSHLLIMEIAG